MALVAPGHQDALNFQWTYCMIKKLGALKKRRIVQL